MQGTTRKNSANIGFEVELRREAVSIYPALWALEASAIYYHTSVSASASQFKLVISVLTR